jgi:hypothetical protein
VNVGLGVSVGITVGARVDEDWMDGVDDAGPVVGVLADNEQACVVIISTNNVRINFFMEATIPGRTGGVKER